MGSQKGLVPEPSPTQEHRGGRPNRPPLKPRLLTPEQAAEYLSLPVATVVREGWGRVQLGIYTRYDVNALDALLDERSGLTAQSAPPAADNDAEAALARSISGATRHA